MQQHEGKLAGSVGRSHLFRYFTVSGGLKCLYYSVYSPCCQGGGKWTKYTDLAFFCSLCRRGSRDSDYFWPRGQMAEAATASEQPLRHGDVHQQAQKSETHSQFSCSLQRQVECTSCSIFDDMLLWKGTSCLLCLHSADFTSTPPTAPPWKWTSPCCRSHSPTPSAWFWHMVKDEKRKPL